MRDGTIFENVAYTDTTSDNAAEDALLAFVDEALRISAAEFAFDLPAGVHTEVGEQGRLLSGGQTARLALARAVFKVLTVPQARIVLIDEVRHWHM